MGKAKPNHSCSRHRCRSVGPLTFWPYLEPHGHLPWGRLRKHNTALKVVLFLLVVGLCVFLKDRELALWSLFVKSVELLADVTADHLFPEARWLEGLEEL